MNHISPNTACINEILSAFSKLLFVITEATFIFKTLLEKSIFAHLRAIVIAHLAQDFFKLSINNIESKLELLLFIEFTLILFSLLDVPKTSKISSQDNSSVLFSKTISSTFFSSILGLIISFFCTLTGLFISLIF